MKIVVDVMGGDKAPQEIIQGCLLARDEYNVDLVLVGRQNEIKDELNKSTNNFNKIDIINAENVITNNDKAAMAIRRKKDSSLVKALNAVKNNEGDAVVSAGSTGAILSGGLFILGRIQGIERPALAPVMPTMRDFSLLIDAGANVDCKPEFLYQFATMGSIYMERVLNIKSPSVGLVNIGTEEGKGNKLVIDTYKLLKDSNLNFYGNLECRDIPKGLVDIIVCDGFVGNTILKLTEGLVKEVMTGLKDAITSSLKSKVGGLLIKSSLSNFKSRFDYKEYGGAPLLGVKAPVIKAHGTSDRVAVKNAIRQAKLYIENDVNRLIEESVNKEVRM